MTRRRAIRRKITLSLHIGVLLVLFPLLHQAPGWAQETALPAGRLADLALKILTYDQKLPQRVKDTIHIGIVFPGARETEARNIQAEFNGRKSFRVSGFPFDVALLPYESLATGERWTAWVVLPGEAAYLEGVSRAARRSGALTIGVCRDCVRPLSLGLSAAEGKINIYRCDECLKAEEVQLSAQFLNITIGR